MSRLSAGRRDMLCQTTVWIIGAGQYKKKLFQHIASNNNDNITLCVKYEEKQLQHIHSITGIYILACLHMYY